MEKRITATEMARTLSEVLNKVAYAGDEYIVERNGKAVCKIVPAGKAWTSAKKAAELFRTLPKVDAKFKEDVEFAIRNQPPLPDPSKWD
jgi:antitoxin (DNA-binding transcriptional repressor) of toxin-antitoxin stability system